jgi:hypothetical protein
MKRLLFILFVLFSGSLQAAVNVAGVSYDDKEKIGSSEAVLNGAGVRSKLVFKVYAVALYLPEKKSTAADALAVKGAKRLHVVVLRDVAAETLADALVKGIEHNSSEAESALLAARVAELKSAMLSLKEVPSGATVLLDWLPDSGTRLSFNGKAVGRDIPGEDLYRAVLKVWLGESPAQDNLKDALLGKPQ